MPDLDGRGRVAVHSRSAGTLVSPYPIPDHHKEVRIGHEVEQVVEPAMRIIARPTVQLGLDLQYPGPCLVEHMVQFVGIHQRSLLTFHSRPLLTCWPPSPCDRLSRSPWRVVTPATTTRPLPHAESHQSTTDLSATAGLAARPGRKPPGGSHVHHAIDRSVRRPALPRQHRHGYAADLHHGLPTDRTKRLRSPATASDCAEDGLWCTAHRPTSARLEHGFAITGRQTPVHSRCTF